MRPRSSGFDEAVANSASLAVEASVITPTGEEPIDVLDGSVTLDATAASRGRLDLTLPVEYIPTSSTDLVAPYGNEIRIARGVDDELIGLGVFRVQSADIQDSGSDLSLQVSGVDRSIRIIEAVFEDTYTTPQDVLIPDHIAAVVQEVYPDVEMNFATTSLRTYGYWTAQRGSDRWDYCQIWAEAMGCELYFDGDGVLTLKPQPTGISPPVAYLEEGAGGVLLSANPSWTRDDAVNRVVVNGSTVKETGEPAYGEAIDEEPTSPTRYGGPFGTVTFEYDTSAVDGLGIHDGGGSLIATDTDAEAEALAQRLLAQKVGTSRNLSVEALVNPAIEPNDVVQITRERAGISQEIHVLDSVTHPLSSGGTMTAQTRETRVA